MDRLRGGGRAVLKRFRGRLSLASIGKFLFSRIIILVPLSATFVGFILVTIALFAGIQQGVLEDFDIFRVDTSTLGHNIVNTVFDAVSLNATVLGDEIIGVATGQPSLNTSDNVPNVGGLLGARAADSIGDDSPLEHVEVPRALLDGLIGAAGNAAGAAAGAAGVPVGLAPPGPAAAGPAPASPANALPSLPLPSALPAGAPQGQTQKGQTNAAAGPSNANPLDALASAVNPAPSAAVSNGAPAASGIPALLSGAANGVGGAALGQGKAQIYAALQTAFDAAKAAIKSNLAGVGDSTADQITRRLNVSEWYSLHVIDLCQGTFNPSGNDKGSGLNTTFCNVKPANRLDSAKSYAEPFVIGPITVDLSKTNLPETINQMVDLINGLLLGLFLLYLFSVLLSLLSLGTTLASFIFPFNLAVIVVNLAITSGAAVLSTIASLVITIVSSILVNTLNKLGVSVGLSATRGDKFIALTWVGSVMLLLATGFWVGLFAFVRISAILKKRRQRRNEKLDRPENE